jgi:hypothetical protein
MAVVDMVVDRFSFIDFFFFLEVKLISVRTDLAAIEGYEARGALTERAVDIEIERQDAQRATRRGSGLFVFTQNIAYLAMFGSPRI